MPGRRGSFWVVVGKVVWKTPLPEGSRNGWGQLSRRQQAYSQAQVSGLVAEPCPLWATEARWWPPPPDAHQAPGTLVLWTVLGPGMGLLHRACLGSFLWERELLKAMGKGYRPEEGAGPPQSESGRLPGPQASWAPPRQLWLLGHLQLPTCIPPCCHQLRCGHSVPIRLETWSRDFLS